jgi:OOP family OmpA-OmpF porin
MKIQSLILAAAFVFTGVFGLNAQDRQNPWTIELGTNAVDFYPVGLESGQILDGVGPGRPFVHGAFINEYFNFGDHYNFMPSASRVAVGRYLFSGLSLNVAGSINKIDKLGDAEFSDWFGADSARYYGLDAALNFSFADAFDQDWVIDPYLGFGAGRSWIKYGYAKGFNTLNANVGFKFWVMEDRLAINVMSTFKSGLDDTYSQDHFQHSAGLVFQFGGKDTDGDGINDDEDECPAVPGLKEFNGCPDTDGDGIEDAKDECPEVAGSADFNGCPDTDGDGVEDRKDECPKKKGPVELGGCPDRDKDGVADKDDACPTQAGDPNLGGCPDADGDGVADKDDSCPQEAGTVANGGCPEMSVEVVEDLNSSTADILFTLGSSALNYEAKAILDEIAQVLKAYPTTYLEIAGHTCNIDTFTFNQGLSEARAKAVRQYLITKQGINPSRLTAKGYGENEPIADNSTADGRAKNRRVEIRVNE